MYVRVKLIPVPSEEVVNWVAVLVVTDETFVIGATDGDPKSAMNDAVIVQV